MGLKLVIGRAGSGKTSYCVQHIQHQLREEPSGAPIIYLVPEQMSFQAENDLLSTPDLEGMIRAQVYSFTRLAWRVLQDTGGLARYHIHSVGLHMMLRKLIEQRRPDLRVFHQAADQPGFLEQLADTFTEWKRHNVQARDVAERLTRMEQGSIPDEDDSPLFYDKLHDLHALYADLEVTMHGHYVQSEDYLPLLNNRIPQSTYMQQATVWVDGFHHFTPQEVTTIQSLIETCQDVIVTLTLDKPYDGDLPNEWELFYPTARTYQLLHHVADESGVEIHPSVVLSGRHGRFTHSPYLRHLEQSYRQSQHQEKTALPFHQGKSVLDHNEHDHIHDAPIHLRAAVHRRAEVEGAAREIVRLVRDEGYRWRDIAIMIRNADEYNHLLQTIMGDYEIPIFLDEKRPMLDHPLLEFIYASLDVLRSDWSYDAVFRCLKTELLFPLPERKATSFERLNNGIAAHFGSKAADEAAIWRDRVDQLENIVLAFGIRGEKRWTSEEQWRLAHVPDDMSTNRQTAAEHIHTWKQALVAPLNRFCSAMKKSRNVREMCTAIVHYMEDANVVQQLNTWRMAADAEGNVQLANEHEQVWQALLDLLDQLVELVGDVTLPLEQMIGMIESGMEELRFSMVPPSLDHVLVASVDRSRLSAIKCAFLLGCNDGVIPALPQEGSILSEEERERLKQSGLEMAAGATEQLMEEPFIIYNALLRASDRLWLSYPLADEEGKSLLPSPLLSELKTIFPHLPEHMLVALPEEIDSEAAQEYVSVPQATAPLLAGQLQRWKHGYAIADVWWDVYNEMREGPFQPLLDPVLASVRYRNQESALPESISRRLYGERLQASVSRMEQFQACPFAHFAAHGLRLKERQLFRLEAPDIGQLFHDALSEMAVYLRRNGMEWAALSAEECQDIAARMVDECAPRLQHEILFSSNRYHYIHRKLRQVIGRASEVIRRQSQKSAFSPVALELPFGPDQPLPPVTFTLGNGCTMELVGRIDRVDQARSESGLLLRIIDYKSSATDLHLADVYYGLALQLITYLDVLISGAEQWLGEEATPAGILYFHVHNPLLSVPQPLDDETLAAEMMKAFKMKGLILADPQTVQLMDEDAQNGHSQIVPAGLKKNGEFYKSASIASQDEMDAIRDYVRRTMVDVGTDLMKGTVSITPYEWKKKTPCTFCSYRPVCQFDPALDHNTFRRFPDHHDIDWIARMQKGEDSDE